MTLRAFLTALALPQVMGLLAMTGVYASGPGGPAHWHTSDTRLVWGFATYLGASLVSGVLIVLRNHTNKENGS